MEYIRCKRIETKPVDDYIGNDINFIDFDKSLEQINKITNMNDLKELADKYRKLAEEMRYFTGEINKELRKNINSNIDKLKELL